MLRQLVVTARLSGALLAVLLLVPGAARAADGLPLKFGYNVSAPIAAFVAAQGTDAFAREKIALDLQLFQDTSGVRDALIAKQVELAGIGFATALQVIPLGAP
jgi:ABC-type nitrate/sulfonate/bicarbonate transport system substrate-binding protein